MSEVIEHYVSEHASLKGSLPGSELDWLNESRDQAIEQFSAQGFPTLRVEDWKYTSIRPIEKRQFKLSQDTDHAIDEENPKVTRLSRAHAGAHSG